MALSLRERKAFERVEIHPADASLSRSERATMDMFGGEGDYLGLSQRPTSTNTLLPRLRFSGKVATIHIGPAFDPDP